MTHLLDRLPEAARDRLVRCGQPRWIEPMLATLTDDRFSDPRWLYERKLDGARCLAFKCGADLRLYSRSGRSVIGNYPEVVLALVEEEADDFVVDGEVVAFEGRRMSFSRLQPRMQTGDPHRALDLGIPVFYYLFDLLYLDGHDLRNVPLRHRKALLRRAVRFEDPLRYMNHRNERGVDYYEEACAQGWEGVIAKRADGRYRSGRTRDWLKFKCVNEQEFVVGGYTEPSGRRIGFGALLVGYYDGGDLVYAGKVGTGYDNTTLVRLKELLDRLETDSSPFVGGDLPRGAHWVRPELIAQVGFGEWTPEGRLRHPRYLGLRDDKSPREVTREIPAG